MGYISLPSNLNAIIGTSCYWVTLKTVILHDAIKTIQNGFFAFFYEQTPVSFKKNKNIRIFKKRVFFNGFFSTLFVFHSFL